MIRREAAQKRREKANPFTNCSNCAKAHGIIIDFAGCHVNDQQDFERSWFTVNWNIPAEISILESQ